MAQHHHLSLHRLLLLFTLFGLLLGACSSDGEGQEKKTSTETTDVKQADAQKSSSLKNILFYGNSLTAAYGLDPSDGYVALIQQKLEAEGLGYRTINAGVSGETTAGGNNRIAWVLEQQKLDVFFLELGGNDGLRGIDPDASFQNLEAIVKKVMEKYPDCRIILAGMEAPPNMGNEYTSAFRNIYKRLAEAYKLELMPFFLKDVGGIPSLNQEDGIHPTAEGNKIIAENVWAILKPLLV